jgi:Helix-turn-helix domain
MDEKKATPEKQAALIEIREQIKGNSTKSQCARLREALARFSINTYEASRFLDIYHAPARVLQLRKRGENIVTSWQRVETEAGVKHRVGEYALIPKVSDAQY